MLNYNVNFSTIEERIEKEQCLLGVAKALKQMSNASDKVCLIFAKYFGNYLSTCNSGYSMGEYVYLAFKGNKFAYANKTSSYSGRAKKYNRNISYGEIVINFKTKKELKQGLTEFYNYVIGNSNINYYNWDKYIDLNKSKIKEKYIIDAIKKHQIA